MAETNAFLGTGRRKTAIARVRMAPGSGKITVNGRAFEVYFPLEQLRMQAVEPLTITETAAKFDLRISQELPGFSPDHSSLLYFNIENLGNLLNDDWGVLKEQSFPRRASAVIASIDDNGTSSDFSDDTYVYEDFFSQNLSRSTRASLWRIRMGFTYRF